MLNEQKRPYNKESDLLKVYRRAFQNAKFFTDPDDKLLSYNSVIQYCTKSEKCLEDQGLKHHQVLFWTYNNIGDIFLQKNINSFHLENCFNALDSFQTALGFSKEDQDQTSVLRKMLDVYKTLEDIGAGTQNTRKLAEIIDGALKIEMFLNLANGAALPAQKSDFLEQALFLITEENAAFLKNCKSTLALCDRLLEIYQKAERKAEFYRKKAGKQLV